ncbi:hypothetical protein CWM22_04495 [Streptococcus suis]|nr:hypothetical protein CWM22_04495 [Streptococcus suis]
MGVGRTRPFIEEFVNKPIFLFVELKQSIPRLLKPINLCAEMLTLTLRNGAGLEPSLCNNESSDKKGSSKIRHGYSYLEEMFMPTYFHCQKKALESRL